MARLIIISNRLPVTIDKVHGELFYYPSAGGLATGLNSLSNDIERLWIGWPGKEIKEKEEQQTVTAELKKSNLVPVFLSKKEIKLYYEGFSNKVIWPHFHYFTQYTSYEPEFWEAYKKVNEQFAATVIEQLRPDDLVWVHDYQLMLLPNLIRQAFPEISIGFFLHIPFPSYEIFRILPWREAIIEGLLGADQIGFHTYGYMRHFLSAAYRVAGYEHNLGKLTVKNRTTNVDVYPMGIDYNSYAFPGQTTDTTESDALMEKLLAKKRKLVISIDRLDYTKGIPQRLLAFEKFLKENKKYHGKITFMLIVVPSRSNVDQYQELKTEVEQLVGRIDGEFRTFGWSPIQYFYRSFSFAALTALYKAADIAMITPLRDGMNLVAKEYVASKEESKQGVLILSEMAGAADELIDALIVNPQDQASLVNALLTALEMSPKEQKDRLIKMQTRLKNFTVENWAQTFIRDQIEFSKTKEISKTNLLNKEKQNTLIADYQKAKKCLFLLDYDGTLMNFNADPQAVIPDQSLMDTLTAIKDNPSNKLVVISGRDRQTLGEWLGGLNIDMAAEHGVWIKDGETWESSIGLASEWKKDIRPALENLVNRTPGSFIEEKEFSIAWHYRKIDKGLGELRVREFRDVLVYLTSNLDLQVLEGNKVVEIKNAGINKGKATLNWTQTEDYDFILAIGDDHTDEDTFKALPADAYTIKVGLDQTAARFNLLSVEDVRVLLTAIINTKK